MQNYLKCLFPNFPVDTGSTEITINQAPRRVILLNSKHDVTGFDDLM